MKKRIVAWVSLILLALMYIGALICAIIGTADAMTLFLVCIVGTIAIPIMAHFVLMMDMMKKGGSLLDNPYGYKPEEEEK